MKPILRVENLKTHFVYPSYRIKAVDGISFNLSKAETLGIVGESGSGKSITALSIMRLLPKYASIIEGKIHYYTGDEQRDILSLKNSEMNALRGKKIGLIFQEAMSNFNPIMRCFDQLKEAVRIHHTGYSKAELIDKSESLIKDVQLPLDLHILKAYPHELSGGQIQRMMIAMALAGNPEILIADEPTTALDVTIQKALLELLLDLKNKHKLSMILISHDLNVIAEVSDKVCVMKDGKFVEKGSISEIFKKPAHLYTQALISCRPTFDKKLKSLPVIEDFFTKTDTNETPVKLQLHDIPSLGSEMKRPILTLKNISKSFSKDSLFKRRTTSKRVVDNVSFQILSGETLGLVGESGSGKTTIANIISGLVKADKGEVYFEKAPIFNADKEYDKVLRKKIQMIFQDPSSSLTPHLSIGQHIVEVFEIHSQDPKQLWKVKAIKILEKVGLAAEYYSRYPKELSGGQRQRVCIARAIAAEPDLIICDEAVSALDVPVQAKILNLLKDLADEYGISYLFISHDLSVVYYMSDKIIVLKNGKIVERGNEEEVFKNPKHPYTEKLVKSIPYITGKKKTFN